MQYTYNGSQLTQMTKGEYTLNFTYDANGTPMTVNKNGTTYYYATNLQGDVMNILDADGEIVASYRYDAWGLLYSSYGDLAELNPLRYRGYVYDNETELYYLQSRYYNPELCRFISPDNFVSTGQGFVGNNMFAYCNNNPIMHTDISGEFPWFAVIGVVVFAIVGGVLGYTYDGTLGVQSSQQEDSKNLKPLPPNQSNTPYFDKNENGEIDSSPQNNESELTAEDRLTNAFIGTGLGLAVGGAVVATGGAAGAVIVGSATAYIGFFGGTALQTMAIGALAYDIFAIVIAPFFGLEMETIEIEP